jgi:nucleoside diphosphate kinase
MDMTWLKTLAPTVASALGGPLAGMAVTAIGSALGWQDATQEKITDLLQSGQLTGEQIAAIKIAELELKTHESDNGFKFSELEIRDRDSARGREIQVKDNTNKILAFVIVGAFIIVVITTMMGWTKAESVLAGTLIGYLSAKAEQVLAYYFGSTQSSARKTELISQSAPPAK